MIYSRLLKEAYHRAGISDKYLRRKFFFLIHNVLLYSKVRYKEITKRYEFWITLIDGY